MGKSEKSGKSKLYSMLSGLNQIKWRVALKGILAGAVAGLAAALFRLMMEFGIDKAVKIYTYLGSHPLMSIIWVLCAAVAGTVIARLVKREPMAAGSGVPQVEGMLIYGLKMKSRPVLLIRFLCGLISSFFGLSLGWEGPSVQIGAAASQALVKKSCKNKLEENYLVTAGAAAGLSAAFNSPLSAIVFVLEEVHRSFSGLILITATTASLTADVISKLFFGMTPVLSFTQTPTLPEKLYFWLLPLGIITGLVGSLLNKSLLSFQSLFNKLPSVLRPCLSLFIALPCGLFFPQVLGGGQQLVDFAETAEKGIMILLLLLGVKFLFTCTSFGGGVPGGIFLPILSIGALTGGIAGMIAVRFGMPAQYISDFAVCGMAGVLSGCVKTPVTSILLTAETTGSLVHLCPVAICSFISMFIADILNLNPIYEALLKYIVSENEETIRNEKSGSIIEIPVEYGSSISGKRISEVNLPRGVLIVGIRRGEEDIVPNGNTKINSGDYLMVISSEHSYRTINKKMREICFLR